MASAKKNSEPQADTQEIREAAQDPSELAVTDTQGTAPETADPFMIHASDNYMPFEARTRGITAVRRTPDGPPVSYLPGGTPVRIIGNRGDQVKLDNGLFVAKVLLDLDR